MVPCKTYMGGCQNYGPFLGTLNIRGRTIIGTPKGTIILTTTHMSRDRNPGLYGIRGTDTVDRRLQMMGRR